MKREQGKERSIPWKRVLTVTLSFMMVFTLIPWFAADNGGFVSAADPCDSTGTWGDWTATKPAAGAIYDTRTEYRYRTRSKTSTSTSTYSAPDSSWTYDYSSRDGAYGSYSAWQTSQPTSYSYREITTRTVTDQAAYTQYNWYYYRYWNTSAGKYYYTYSSSMGGTKYTWSTTYMLPQIGTYDGRAGYKPSGGKNFSDEIWWLESQTNVAAKTHTEWRYRDKAYVYYWWKWGSYGSWSSWGTTAYTGTDSRQVETRTAYRVWTPNAHTWNAGTITRKAGYTHTGAKVHTCTVCNATKTVAIPKLNAAPVTPAKTKIVSAKVASKKLTLKWNRVKAKTKGYQIAIKNKKTKKIKYYTVKASSKSKITKKIKLKKGTYAVMVRAFNKVNGETIYGAWSNVKSGKVK